MKEILDFEAWTEWIRSLDNAWLFLLVLALVVAVVMVWSSTLRPDNTKEPSDEDSGT